MGGMIWARRFGLSARGGSVEKIENVYTEHVPPKLRLSNEYRSLYFISREKNLQQHMTIDISHSVNIIYNN